MEQPLPRREAPRGVLAAAYGVLAIVAVLVAVWGFLWLASSSSLACVPCNCTYSLFHELPRCRQPSQALIVLGVGIIGAILCVVRAIFVMRGKSAT